MIFEIAIVLSIISRLGLCDILIIDSDFPVLYPTLPQTFVAVKNLTFIKLNPGLTCLYLLWLKTIQLLIIHQMHPNPEPHNFPLVHLNLYTKLNYCCYTYTDVSSAKIFCMDFTAENKNIYNLHGWQLGVTNKTRSQFAAYNRDKIIDWWKIGLIILSASPG